MGRINWGRVLMGALVYFVVAFVMEMLWGLMMEKRLMAAVSEEVRQAMTRPGVMIFYVGWGLLISFVAIWIYAAIRPRYGPGPRTAIVTGVMVWALGNVSAAMTAWTFRLVPGDLLAMGLVWGLLQAIAATLAGAWAYRES